MEGYTSIHTISLITMVAHYLDTMLRLYVWHTTKSLNRSYI